MGQKLPTVSGKQLLIALERAGFKVLRIVGSHHVLHHDDGRKTSVPVHGSDLGCGLLAKILRDVRMTGDDLRRFL